ncbi:hypothetical protein V2J56_07540 [Georgenia sp. MJ206]|uniref:hypothetical protein n=1 Tax=Georgenia wangjunii TaxID=3117730 RepID=UPI002F2698DC
MAVQKIRPHLYRLLLGRHRAHLWSDGDGSPLVDGDIAAEHGGEVTLGVFNLNRTEAAA